MLRQGFLVLGAIRITHEKFAYTNILGLALHHTKHKAELRFAVPGYSLQSFCAGRQKGFPLLSLSRNYLTTLVSFYLRMFAC